MDNAKVIEVVDNMGGVKYKFKTYNDYIRYLRSSEYNEEYLTRVVRG